MSNPISYEIIKAILMGDHISESDLKVVLNFLEHTTSIIRHLYWNQRIENKQCDLNNKKSAGVN